MNVSVLTTPEGRLVSDQVAVQHPGGAPQVIDLVSLIIHAANCWLIDNSTPEQLAIIRGIMWTRVRKTGCPPAYGALPTPLSHPLNMGQWQ